MIDTIVFEESNHIKKIAGLKEGDLRLFVYQDAQKVNEGNVYLGKITKKIQSANGKQAYFVNIGSDREAFINAEEHGLEDLVAHEGQDIIIQVLQEKRAEKGAKVSRFLSFIGVNVIFCPYGSEIEISSKIADETERERLFQIVSETAEEGGWIVRTHAAEASVSEIKEEINSLQQSFADLISRAKTLKSPCLLYAKDNVLDEMMVQEKETLSKVVVNSHILQEKLQNLVATEYCAKPFEDYGIEEMLQNALSKSVKLKCGGRLFIEETKAFVAIDVDSGEGQSQGGFNKLNQEAAEEIAKQIILRNLSGKIIIDFAGVTDYKFLKNIINMLERGLCEDNTKTNVLGLSRAGNVEIIRQRRRPSLSDVLTKECECCQGTGRVEK